MADIKKVAVHYNAWIKSDNEFQRRARLLQSIWREKKGYAAGEHKGQMLGSRITEADAIAGHNFLTPGIHKVAKRAKAHRNGQVIEPNRLFGNLLSSQPLCFNLFGELADGGNIGDFRIATSIFSEMIQRPMKTVSHLEFEKSPGRGDVEFLGDGTAFDFYVEYVTAAEGKGFIGIEIKYHENLVSTERITEGTRYHEVATRSEWFRKDAYLELGKSPLVQIWRDHLLAASMLQHKKSDFQEGYYLIIYPHGNRACSEAIARYRTLLDSKDTFIDKTLEQACLVLKKYVNEKWLDEFEKRYLDFAQVDRLIG